MSKIKNTTLFVLIFIFLANLCFAQKPEVLKTKKFSSLRGEFYLEVPAGHLGGGGPLRENDTNGLGTGYYTYWSSNELTFRAEYINIDLEKNNLTPENIPLVLDFIRETITANIEKNDTLKLLSAKKFSLDQYTGQELIIESGQGKIFLRHYLVNKRLYKLTGTTERVGNETIILKFLNSFKILTREEVIAQKIKDATPEPLPQKPVTKNLQPDLDKNLKGKVKSEVLEIETIGDENSAKNRRKMFEHFYDKRGFLIKSVNYDFDGTPNSVSAYGFIDGMRVEKVGYVQYENKIFGVMASPKPQKPRDQRYTLRYVPKYNNKNQILEKNHYANNGEILFSLSFSYSDEEIVIIRLDENGKLEKRTSQTLDDKGNVIKESAARMDQNLTANHYSYEYTEFDKKGNWTKRIRSELIGNDTRSGYKPSFREYRTFTYYE